MRLLQAALFMQLIFVGYTEAQNSLNNLIVDAPDSIVVYNDSEKTELSESIIHEYSDNKITLIYRYWEEGQWVNEEKIERYMNSDFPKMKFDPLILGFEDNDEYYCNHTLGDSLTTISIWDEDTESWGKYYKTKHYVSDEGIDTLAITKTWNSILQ